MKAENPFSCRESLRSITHGGNGKEEGTANTTIIESTFNPDFATMLLDNRAKVGRAIPCPTKVGIWINDQSYAGFLHAGPLF